MAAKRKSWTEKMNHPASPEVKRTDKNFADIPAGSLMLIPTPRLVEDYLKHSTPGKQVEMRQIRADLAAENGAEYTCPLTTGIFLRILTEYANELKNSGVPLTALPPVWRVLKPGLPIWKKLQFDTGWIREAREQENLPQ